VSIGDELPAGIMKLAKVYLANKRKLTVGDKWPDATATRVS
jgi:DNA-directed RNA polymerase subunit beta